MNRLLQRAPAAVMIDGVAYPVNTNFRDCLLTITAIDDPSLINEEKAEVVLDNVYAKVAIAVDGRHYIENDGHLWPENIAEAINQALWFLGGGREVKDGESGKERPMLTDFNMDSQMIYDAMLIRGVDLDKEDMHLWRFWSLYSELPESRFTQIISLRYKYRKGKLDSVDTRSC